MIWSQGKEQYKVSAKLEFAEERNADAWLLSYVLAEGGTVVTHEKLSRDVKSRIPISNVCEEFDIEYLDTFRMLRLLQTEFNLLNSS